MAPICCLWFSGSLVTDFESDDRGNVTEGLRRQNPSRLWNEGYLFWLSLKMDVVCNMISCLVQNMAK